MTQALEKRQQAVAVLQSENFKTQLQNALPKILPLEKFVRTCITSLTKNPKLCECSQQSLFGSIIQLAQVGLEADGYHAHLIPYGSICTAIVDYKGLIELMYRTDKVSSINGYVVKENDDFDFVVGEVPTHKIKLGNRGKTVGAYTVVTMKDGSKSVEVMGIDEIEAIRERSKSGNNGPWKTDFDEMAKKTVLRRHSKWVPISAEAKEIVLKEVEAEVQNNKPSKVTLADIVGGESVADEKQAEIVDDLGDDFEKATEVK